MKIIDSHSHYNLQPLFVNWANHWQQAQQQGLTNSIVVGACLLSSQKAVKICQQEPALFAAVGLHPHVAQKSWENANLPNLDSQITELTKLAQDSTVIALGETGLDYYLPKKLNSRKTQAIKQTQKKLFDKHLELAHQYKKMLIVHVRDKKGSEQAYLDTLNILQKNSPEYGLILHCISGSKQYIKQALELGAYLGIAGNITYPTAGNIRSIVKYSPKEKLLVETDCPYLAPQAYRGQTCRPWMIKQTVKTLEKLGVSPKQLYQNSLKVINR